MENLSCGIIQDLLISYCDGLTGENITQMLQEHLVQCQNCRQRYEEMQKQRECEYNAELSKGREFGEKLKGIRYYALGIVIGCFLPVAGILLCYAFCSVVSYFEVMFYSYFL